MTKQKHYRHLNRIELIKHCHKDAKAQSKILARAFSYFNILSVLVSAGGGLWHFFFQISNKIILILLLFIVVSAAHSQKKYQIKSAIITFENTITIMGMAVSQKQILYFDDYGIKECKELYEDTTLMESVFSDGKDTYTVVFDEKVAYKTGKSSTGTEPAFSWNDVPDADKKSGKAKKLDSMTVAGKMCEAYEHAEGEAKTIIAGWNNVRLYVDLKSKDINSISKAVTIKENAKIPADKFKGPKGFTVKKQE